jgi:iron complex transport system substrate-binding protein
VAASRIVSLVPSLSHMVCDFGLKDNVVGCTTFCVEPRGLTKRAKIVGGTKDPDLAVIKGLKPTHIIVNEEENKPEHIAECQKIAPTFKSFPKSPADVPKLLRDAGQFLGVPEQGATFASDVERELEVLNERVEKALKHGRHTSRRYLYFIWREPYMVAGPDSYISAMLDLIAYTNATPAGPDRYPTLDVAAAKALAPDLLLLSTEPYPFRQRDAERLEDEWPDVPEILKADGQLLSWYGTLTATGVRALRDYVQSDDPRIMKPFSSSSARR